VRIPSLFGSFNHSVRSMQQAQYALTVHGSNIAHANDKDYTRRDVLPFTESFRKGPGIVRLRDRFIDDQFRRTAGKLGDAEVRQSVLTKVEDIFGDPVNGGLRSALDGFFDAWQGLAENPSDGVARIEVINKGSVFAEQIRSTYRQLADVEQTVNEELLTRVDEVNNLVSRVFDLNIKISNLSRNFMDDAELRDQRDVALDRLAELTGAMAMDQPDGTVRVVVGSTVVLDGPITTKLLLTNTVDGPTPTWAGYTTPTYNGSGTIEGLVTVRNGDLKTLKKHIDDLGRSVGNAVNDQHLLGYPLGGGVPEAFFNFSAAPADITVNPDITPATLAVAGTSTGLPSDGDNARLIAALADKPIIESPIITGKQEGVRSFYRNLIGWIGTQSAAATQDMKAAEAHKQITEGQRQAQWGVSLDEEVAHLTMEQKAFAAAARVITVMDQMLDDLLNAVRR